MATIKDTAAYILEKAGSMTAMKLQKLCYYSQAWSIVWDDEPLFQERFEAWVNGPVSPVLYTAHRGAFRVGPGEISGDPKALTFEQQRTVDAVITYYGKYEPHQLSDLTHAEKPWQEARRGLRADERGDREITVDAMDSYYRSL